MAVNREPILKRCKMLGISPMVMGVGKETKRNAAGGFRKKESDYKMQLKENRSLSSSTARAKNSSGISMKEPKRWKVRPVQTSSPSSSAGSTTSSSEWVFP